MDFKKLASDAGTFFSRAKQYTEEKLGQSEKTELDAHFDNLLQRADKTKEWTERILHQTETVLQPNPNVRMEDFLYEKIDKKKRDRMTSSETLGQYMVDSGNEFGPGTSYGSALIKVGQTEQKLGMAEKEYVHATATNFLQPLKGFLEGDMKTLQKERKVLEGKRLDLDACKSRLRRAKSLTTKEAGTEPPTVEEDENVARAEGDLRKAQAEFDRQAEITKLLLEGISSTHAHHLRCLHDFVEAQQTYYAQCQQYMADLQRQLGSYVPGGKTGGGVSGIGGGSTSPDIHVPLGYSGMGANNNPSAPPPPQAHNNSIPMAPNSVVEGNDTRRAKVLYDYDAADLSELSLEADEIIMVSRPSEMDSDWMMGQRGSQQGKVPMTYIQLLN